MPVPSGSTWSLPKASCVSCRRELPVNKVSTPLRAAQVENPAKRKDESPAEWGERCLRVQRELKAAFYERNR